LEQIINLGRIPEKYKFLYRRRLQLFLKNNEKELLANIIEEIGKDMNIKKRLNMKLEKWSFMIDENYDFLAMSEEYINNHFK
jgi:hypothetical protein